jgi:CheY-like chemotaxis protein
LFASGADWQAWRVARLVRICLVRIRRELCEGIISKSFDVIYTGRNIILMAKAFKPTILIVDDDPYIRKMLVEVLGLEGYPLETATNGQEALEALDKGAPRLILLDLLMPVVDGRAVMNQLRATPEIRARHKIVLVSANDRLEAARDLEPDSMLAKPFTVDQLLNVIETASAGLSM